MTVGIPAGAVSGIAYGVLLVAVVSASNIGDVSAHTWKVIVIGAVLGMGIGATLRSLRGFVVDLDLAFAMLGGLLVGAWSAALLLYPWIIGILLIAVAVGLLLGVGMALPSVCLMTLACYSVLRLRHAPPRSATRCRSETRYAALYAGLAPLFVLWAWLALLLMFDRGAVRTAGQILGSGILFLPVLSSIWICQTIGSRIASAYLEHSANQSTPIVSTSSVQQ